MRRFILAATAVATMAAVPGLASAAPMIIATSVTSACRDTSSGPPTTVTVVLNPTTNGFFGAGLYYHFTPVSGGTAVTKPSPNGLNPVYLGGITPGSYKLRISDAGGPGGSYSADYPVTVPAYNIQHLGNHYFCPAVAKVGTRINGAIRP